MNKIQGIYLIKNVINGKVYVGQSNDVLSRIKSHFSPKVYLSFSYPLYNAIKKYGITMFDVSLLELVVDSSKLDEREQYWMDYYKCYESEYGYNLKSFANSSRGYRELPRKPRPLVAGMNWQNNLKNT